MLVKVIKLWKGIRGNPNDNRLVEQKNMYFMSFAHEFSYILVSSKGNYVNLYGVVGQ